MKITSPVLPIKLKNFYSINKWSWGSKDGLEPPYGRSSKHYNRCMSSYFPWWGGTVVAYKNEAQMANGHTHEDSRCKWRNYLFITMRVKHLAHLPLETLVPSHCGYVFIYPYDILKKCSQRGILTFFNKIRNQSRKINGSSLILLVSPFLLLNSPIW